MGGWDSTMNVANEDYTPHYIWYPTLLLYVQNVQNGLLTLKPFRYCAGGWGERGMRGSYSITIPSTKINLYFSTISKTKKSLKIKEKTDILVQCTIVSIQEDTNNFILKLLDINRQSTPLEVTVPHSLLHTVASFHHLPPHTTPLRLLEYFIGAEGDRDVATPQGEVSSQSDGEVSAIQELQEKIANVVFVCGLELYCIAWRDFVVDAVCFYKPENNT